MYTKIITNNDFKYNYYYYNNYYYFKINQRHFWVNLLYSCNLFEYGTHSVVNHTPSKSSLTDPSLNLCSCKKLNYHLVNIHWLIALGFPITLIHWIEIYPADRIIHPSDIWGHFLEGRATTSATCPRQIAATLQSRFVWHGLRNFVKIFVPEGIKITTLNVHWHLEKCRILCVK